MNTYYCFHYKTYKENTAEYGFGDFHDKRYYLVCAVKADTKRKAQNLMKKELPNLRFSGQFSPSVYSQQELDEDSCLDYLKRLIVEKENARKENNNG